MARKAFGLLTLLVLMMICWILTMGLWGVQGPWQGVTGWIATALVWLLVGSAMVWAAPRWKTGGMDRGRDALPGNDVPAGS